MQTGSHGNEAASSPEVRRSHLPVLFRRVKGGGRLWHAYAGLRFGRDTVVVSPQRWHGHTVWLGGLPSVRPSPNFMDLEAHEPQVAWALEQLLGRQRNATIIDVGANYGQFLTFVKLIAPDATVYSFEPFDDLALSLKGIAWANGWSDVEVECAAAGRTEGPVEIYFAEDARACASTTKEFRPNHPANRFVRTVRGVTLDSWSRQVDLQRLDLLKVDVEGGELEVIQGASELLATFEPDVLVEVLPVGRDDTDSGRFRRERAGAMWRLLETRGYHAWRIASTGDLAPAHDLTEAVTPDDANYLLTRRERPFDDRIRP